VADLDVGLVPLADNAFNRAKSWLKGLEMAAVGVPFVATPTEQYRALHAEGMGLLAESPRQWEGLVKRLVRDEGYRAEQAWQGRERAERWTVEANAERWVDAWSAALSTRAGTLAR
jgi:glycosyltransferase involved in cell wall biosynthesis